MKRDELHPTDYVFIFVFTMFGILLMLVAIAFAGELLRSCSGEPPPWRSSRAPAALEAKR